jgi:hypothetical protein
MKKLFSAFFLVPLLSGCVAHVTPEGTYLEPIPLSIILGPPVIVAPPPRIALRPLPPVVLEPERHVYFYNNVYYYYWDKSWYYGERERGPWHKLPREYYPRQYREKERKRDRDDGQWDREYRQRGRY